MSWGEYVEAAERLDAVRSAEAARTGGIRSAAAEMTQHADSLEERLRGQQRNLAALGDMLKLATPPLTPSPAPEPDDPAPALHQVGQAIDRVDEIATRADRRGRLPALWPQLPATARNLVIYGAAALAALGVQAGALLRDSAASPDGAPDLNFPLLFIAVPLVAFLVASFVVSVAAKPRIEQGEVELARRMGFVLCFLIGPLVVIALIVRMTLTS